jgi:DNA invertase Pin-like site-specific DNA recombinase
MAESRRRAFDAVVVFRFDRFARSVSHLARALDEFRALGIEFVSLHEAVDTSTPMGRAMFHIAGAFAELEREIIRERVKAGLQNARRRGKRLGGDGRWSTSRRSMRWPPGASRDARSRRQSECRRRRYGGSFKETE